MHYPSWKQANLSEKTVIVRSPLDVRLENGKPTATTKFKAAANSIQTLLQQNSKLVILAHQGHDEKEATTLKEHAALLGELIGKKVSFASWKENWKQKVQQLRSGEALLLENVRMLKEEKAKGSAEEHANDSYVKELSQLADCFIQDDFTTCHRAHASMVGFPQRLPSYLGPCAEIEVNALEQAGKAPKPRLLIVGGAKAEDSLNVMTHMLEHGKVDQVLCGGVIGELFHRAMGISFGAKDHYLDAFMLEQNLQEQLMKTRNQFSERIVLPTDFAIAHGHRHNVSLDELPVMESVFDIGTETQEAFANEIARAGSVFWNGPMGKFEEGTFQDGTKSVMNAIENGKAFSVCGGGDTLKAIDQLGGKKERYGHLSIAGGALLDYLAGKHMPGLEALLNNLKP